MGASHGKTPLVSVVMPTFRRAAQIEKSIRSLLVQDLTDFELLVCDDGTEDDGTEGIVLSIAQHDRRVEYSQNPKPLRMPENLNSGIRRARGRYIAVCHDHDLYRQDFLSSLLALLEHHPTALFAHSAISLIDQDDRPTGGILVGDWKELSPGRDWLAFMLESFSSPVCALTMVRREAHDAFGLYDGVYGFVADVEMWMRLASHGDVAYCRRPLVEVRTREADHAVDAQPWDMLGSIFAMHRKYVPKHYSGWNAAVRNLGLSLRADRRVVAEIAVRKLRSRAVRFTPSSTLWQAGGWFTRHVVMRAATLLGSCHD